MLDKSQILFKHLAFENQPIIPNCIHYLLLQPYLSDPVNFVPFGVIRYSIFTVNLINIHEHNLHRICSF